MKKKGLFYLTLAQDPLVALNESWKEKNTTAFSFLSYAEGATEKVLT
jgi:hypothetical protein